MIPQSSTEPVYESRNEYPVSPEKKARPSCFYTAIESYGKRLKEFSGRGVKLFVSGGRGVKL